MKNFSIQSLYNWYRNLLRHPKYRWWVVIGSLIYLVSPLDISPDVFPVIGWLDDGIIISLLIAEVSQIFKEKLQQSSTRTDKSAEPNETVVGNVVDVKAVEVE